MSESFIHNTTRLVATIGMFDGVHLGHRLVVSHVCRIARERGLKAAVFTFVQHPMYEICPQKAPKAISTVARRSALLVEAGATEVHFMDFDSEMRCLTAEQFMEMLHVVYGVDVLVMGFNHRFGSDRIKDFEVYRHIGYNIGIEVIKADEHTIDTPDIHISSSRIRHAISSGEIRKANIMLGRTFSICGIVGHGHNIGHTIGVPTANLHPFLDNQLMPAKGVYAACVSTRGSEYPAMVNIGVNPTVSHDDLIKIEAHLIGYEGDLYGSVIEVGFISRLRSEHRFDSLSELKRQLSLDRIEAADIYKEWKSSSMK